MIEVQDQPLSPNARWDALREHWPSATDQLIPTRWMLALLAIVAGVVIIWVVVDRLRARYPRIKPLLMFNELATYLGLSLRDQWLLAKIAHQQALSTPLTLLLSGSTLRFHGDRYAKVKRPARRGQVRERLDRIGTVLFGRV